MAKQPSSRQTARLRAEMIMKVRCGLLTARQAADRMGVSRKTFYKWEQRGLNALLDSVTDQPPGRPSLPVGRPSPMAGKATPRRQSTDRPAEPQDGPEGCADGLKLPQTGSDRAKKK
jgi:DNA-binding XRE family transcriptional regulator